MQRWTKKEEDNDDRDCKSPERDDLAPLSNRKDLAIKKQMDEENTAQQDIYGKVVDQYGQPIADVTVIGTLCWNQWPSVAEKQQQHTIQTNQNGEFQFTGYHAARLGVMVRKNGYEMEHSGLAYKAPNVENKTSPSERAIFTMWKLKGAEPMVHCDGHCKLTCDGSGSTSFNLLTGKVVKSGGDLTVSFVRNPVNIDRHNPFDWTLTMQIADGGLMLVPENSAYLNEAPAVGYQSVVAASMAATDKQWNPSYVRTYYFKAKNGQVYGRIKVNLMANYQPPPTHFEFEVYANPNSSRNLEFDPAKQVKY